MMTSLFSVFDPSSSLSLMPNWISLLILLPLLPSSFWLIPSRYMSMTNLITTPLHSEFKTLMINAFPLGGTSIFCALFLMILLNNFTGLFPYIFTSTSHMLINISLALPLWLSFMLFGWINNYNHMLAHLVPLGTPPALMNFMVCIETISSLIRPLTLAIRLTANMIAGHLLLTLLGNQGPMMPSTLLSLLIFSQILLLLLESAVAIIQSYVFSILSVLYSAEVN